MSYVWVVLDSLMTAWVFSSFAGAVRFCKSDASWKMHTIIQGKCYEVCPKGAERFIDEVGFLLQKCEVQR